MDKGKKRLLILSLVVLGIAKFLSTPGVWTWVVFGADYFLGNPSFLYEYSEELMQEAARSWPIPPTTYIPPTPFPEINYVDYTPEAFEALTRGHSSPAIVRGVFGNWSEEASSMWKVENMIKRFGDRTFATYLNNRMGEDQHFIDAAYLPVHQVVKNITEGGNNYMFNCMLNSNDDTDLLKAENTLGRLGIKHPLLLYQFFLGKARPGEKRLSGSPLHAAAGSNYFHQISGVKRWMMIDPRYAYYLRPRLASLQFGCVSRHERQYSKENRFQNFPRFETLVNPGDVLFLPPWWFHEVRNVQSDDFLIATATRVLNPSAEKNNALFAGLAAFGTNPPGSMTPRIFRPIVNTIYYQVLGYDWHKAPATKITGFALDNARLMGGAFKMEYDIE